MNQLIRNKLLIICIIHWVVLSHPGFLLAQGDTDLQLAQFYYTNGDFQKALMYYEKIYDKEPSKFNFNRYYECLVQTGDHKTAEKVLKRQINSKKTDFEYKVLLGQLYEDDQNIEKANEQYNQLIDDLGPDVNTILSLFNAFKLKAKNEFALKTVEKGRRLLKNAYPFNFQFAEIYGAMGQTEKMLNEYLDLLDYSTNYASSIQTILSGQLDFSISDSKEFEFLKVALLNRIQKNPNEPVYTEMLVWLFIQRKNFSAALVQVQALDKRLDEQGRRVFELGNICLENKEYENARKAFKYVIDLGSDKLLYYKAENALLNTLFQEITSQRNYSSEDILTTIDAYKLTLNRIGKKRTSLPLIMELCQIYAYYADSSESAINLLQEALEFPGITDMERGELKMLLADINVLHGDIWEASLLYMQIDNDFKFEPIGHEAKFKSARIFYYDGEFDYAQSQLSVLKESTSKLIANDAMNLSILITDNFGLDSNYQAMTWFANADLLIEQHQYVQAFSLFDSIIKNYPYHSLGDEILLRKAKAMQQLGKWQEAVQFLEELLKYYGDDILADDALFQLGDIYENHLNNREKATEYYKKLLFDFKGSLFAVEVRKRLRMIRGDKNPGDELDDEL